MALSATVRGASCRRFAPGLAALLVACAGTAAREDGLSRGVGGGPGEAPAPLDVGAPEPVDAPPRARPLDEVLFELDLGASADAHARAYRFALEAARAKGDDASTCVAVTKAFSAAEAIGDAVDVALDAETAAAVVGGAADDDHEDDDEDPPDRARALARLAKPLEELAGLLPGVVVAAGFERAEAGVDLAALGGAVRASASARRLLVAVDDVVRPPAPRWFALEDGPTCVDDAAAADVVERIVEAWGEAPPCLQRALAGPLRRELEAAASSTCRCADRRASIEGARRFAAALRALADLRADDVAREAVDAAASSTTRVNGRCDG